MMPACATTVMPAASITESRPTRRWALRLGAAGPTGASRTRSAPDAATCSRAVSMAPRAGAPPRHEAKGWLEHEIRHAAETREHNRSSGIARPDARMTLRVAERLQPKPPGYAKRK